MTIAPPAPPTAAPTAVDAAGDPAPRPGSSRRLVTEIPGSRSRALLARQQASVARGVASALPVFVSDGGAGTLHDVDGNTLLDLSSGIAVTSVGNPAPEVAAAVADQAARLTHTCFTANPYEQYVAVCEALNRLTPGTHAKRTALFTTGAEAVENAVKIARSFTRRQAVVVFDHAFHGRTNLTMGMTAKNMPYKDGFGPFAPEVYRVPGSYPFRDRLTGPEAARQATTLIEKNLGAHNVAAVVIEPVQGEGGFIVPAPGFLRALADWCRSHGVVLVADEIQAGFARTGAWYASEHEGVVPDLITSAKGLAGGMPLAAVTGRAEIMDAPHAGGLGGTYAGNPVACAAALAAIAVVERDGLVERAAHLGRTMIGRLKAVQERVPGIGEVRGRGAMVAVELVRPGTLDPDAAATAAVAAACHRAGVMVLTCGTYGNVLRLLPALVIGDEDLADALDVLEAALAAHAGGTPTAHPAR